MNETSHTPSVATSQTGASSAAQHARQSMFSAAARVIDYHARRLSRQRDAALVHLADAGRPPMQA